MEIPQFSGSEVDVNLESQKKGQVTQVSAQQESVKLPRALGTLVNGIWPSRKGQ